MLWRAVILVLKTLVLLAWCVLAFSLTYQLGRSMSGVIVGWGVPAAAWVGYGAASILAANATKDIARFLYKR